MKKKYKNDCIYVPGSMCIQIMYSGLCLCLLTRRCHKHKSITRHRAIHEKVLGLFHLNLWVRGGSLYGGFVHMWKYVKDCFKKCENVPKRQNMIKNRKKWQNFLKFVVGQNQGGQNFQQFIGSKFSKLCKGVKMRVVGGVNIFGNLQGGQHDFCRESK